VWSGKLWKQRNAWRPFSVHAKRISLRLEEAPQQERYKVSMFHHSSLSLILQFPPGTASRHGHHKCIRLWTPKAPFKNISKSMERLSPGTTQLPGSEEVDQEFFMLNFPFLLLLIYIILTKVTPNLHVLHQHRESQVLVRTKKLHIQPCSRIQLFRAIPLQTRLANRCLGSHWLS
jgi:hypothetical protein